ncbi:sulfite exporter TauE/SafE family protein [Pseudalkalibacillus decolorationis]|uniref:sulfite exporter TauE/SafE family protein n=1 Tax=Pseudalkalibacillus decolorationis TaxID=163879 RepID=UPI00214821B9|nr:sulfite exporter TauE/SafE family protein [Pseudalkalibacillus decolorationis]
MTEMTIILLIILLGSFIQGSSGFGFGLVSMGVLSIFLTLKDSMLIVLALTVILSSRIILKLWKYILLRDLYLILASALLGRILAFFFVAQFREAQFMKTILAFVLIGMVIYLYLKRKFSKNLDENKEKRFVPLISGSFGGFIGGAFAVGGHFFVAYFLSRYQDKRHYIANLQLTFIVLNMMTLFAHGLNGDLNHDFYFYTGTGIVIVLIGVTLGLKLFYRLPTKIIQNIAFTIILVSGLNLMF